MFDSLCKMMRNGEKFDKFHAKYLSTENSYWRRIAPINNNSIFRPILFSKLRTKIKAKKTYLDHYLLLCAPNYPDHLLFAVHAKNMIFVPPWWWVAPGSFVELPVTLSLPISVQQYPKYM